MDESGEVSDSVVVFAPLFPPAFRGGGPIRSIEALIAVAPRHLRVKVVASDTDLGESARMDVVPETWTMHGRASVWYFSVHSLRALRATMRQVRRAAPSLIHVNSLFNPIFSILPLLLWRIGYFGSADVLLSPRGELGEGALARRAPKKHAYLTLFRALGIHRKVLWHATAGHEASAISDMFGPRLRLVERANDTLLPDSAEEPFQCPRGESVRLVFLGRVVEHKGLHLALDGLRDIQSRIDLDVFGSREDELYWRRCESIAASLPPQISVNFHGAIDHAHVRDTLRGFDALVMPTAGENFGHVIAEALSVSCFVLASETTPWTPELIGGGGIVVTPRSARAWGDALAKVAALTPSEREARRRGAGQAYNQWRAKPRETHLWVAARGLQPRDGV